MNAYGDPAFVDELLDFASQVARADWKPQVEAATDTIGMGDAAASMLSPTHHERHIHPAQRRIVEDIGAGAP